MLRLMYVKRCVHFELQPRLIQAIANCCQREYEGHRVARQLHTFPRPLHTVAWQ